ncbi:hypothetical protein Trydic_g19722 [Trypoxylus dichotomus]
MDALPSSLRPLTFLIGKWSSITAKGFYPTIQPFEYKEELEFSFNGQPMLNYKSSTWHLVKQTPMHLESGFLRIKPGTNEIALLAAHNFGITTLEEGIVKENCVILRCSESHISRISFAKQPFVTQLNRVFTYHEETGILEVVVSMATTNTPELTEHLAVTYKKM